MQSVRMFSMEYNLDSVISLISRIHSATQDFTNQILASKSPVQGSFVSSHGYILFLLSSKGPMTMGELSERINRNKSTTTVLIRKLCQMGLVQTRQSPSDSRIRLISLTEEGKKLNTTTSEISRNLLDLCWKDFSKEEREELLKLLLKMNSNLESKGKTPRE